MPFLDLHLARRITEGIVALLARFGPGAVPWPEDRSASEFAEKLRRHDPREVLYLPDLAAEPRWPADIWNEGDFNHERVFLRVSTERREIGYAVLVFDGSLVHWESAIANLDPGAAGVLTFMPMNPDRHWALKLEAPEALLREMGLTVIPPAAMGLRFGRWSLYELLDPRVGNVRAAGEQATRIANTLNARRVRSPAQAYGHVLALLRLGYDLGTLADALEGRQPGSLAELAGWLAERPPPFAWTRPQP